MVVIVVYGHCFCGVWPYVTVQKHQIMMMNMRRRKMVILLLIVWTKA